MEEESDKSKMGDEIDEKKIEEWFKKKFSGEGHKNDDCCKDGKCTCKTSKKNKRYKTGATGAGVWCLGFIGAAIYYIGAATSFWIGVLGFLKAIIWPVFLVYELLKFLGV